MEGQARAPLAEGSAEYERVLAHFRSSLQPSDAASMAEWNGLCHDLISNGCETIEFSHTEVDLLEYDAKPSYCA